MSLGWLRPSFAVCFRPRGRRVIAIRMQTKPRFGASRKGITDEPQTNRRFEQPRAQTAIEG
eukprot:15469084-Alexandrium_andersonii.AAC.4